MIGIEMRARVARMFSGPLMRTPTAPCRSAASAIAEMT